ncbi:hypothetical protein PHYPSEUDO_011580 [Phytophthora pseudosyringae]|uniref:Uncharacterized protein n=1 Tax=Phytophthora pseudosyringae TaxID=221518 RepID=A0A8T1WA33_9STRA|nr:hypothetical protein PHYPSEUDO_011580 [Phytophthora pseudosyringae]
MSLGFLTESALVPSKAKEIKVDTKSLVDLKAVVFQKDQERKRRLREALTAENDDETRAGHGALRLGKYAHLRGGSKRRKQSEEGKKHRNKGVEARSRRDEEAKAREAPREDDDEAWSKKSAEMLRKKAKLYEEMANGGGGDHLKGEWLVDFAAKRYTSEAVSTNGEKARVEEITDEFGRSRKVATDSEEYAAFLETQQQQCRDGELEETNHHGNVEDRDGEDRAGNDGSFVVSQWEKRLKRTEKKHLKEVHERATLAQSLVHSSSAGAVDRKARKQLRLERLRKQREEAAAATSSESAAPTSTVVDSTASEKATDFLSQLSSLM